MGIGGSGCWSQQPEFSTLLSSPNHKGQMASRTRKSEATRPSMAMNIRLIYLVSQKVILLSWQIVLDAIVIIFTYLFSHLHWTREEKCVGARGDSPSFHNYTKGICFYFSLKFVFLWARLIPSQCSQYSRTFQQWEWPFRNKQQSFLLMEN